MKVILSIRHPCSSFFFALIFWQQNECSECKFFIFYWMKNDFSKSVKFFKHFHVIHMMYIVLRIEVIEGFWFSINVWIHSGRINNSDNLEEILRMINYFVSGKQPSSLHIWRGQFQFKTTFSDRDCLQIAVK